MEMYKIIVNPIAGKGLAAESVPEIKHALNKYQISYDLVYTEGPGHATVIAEKAASEGNRGVVAAGSDGTSNEVINGLMKAALEGYTETVLSVFCVGRGNDFAYGIGSPKEIDEGCRLLRDGNAGYIDVGLVKGGSYPKGRYFGNGIGVGFDTIVGLEAAKMKNVHSALAYALGAIKTIFMLNTVPTIMIKLDDAVLQSEFMQISVMNGKRMGGLFFMAPSSNNRDGQFDLCIAEKLAKRKMPGLILQYMKGTQDANSHITMERSKSVILSAPKGGLVVHADGETICTDGTFLDITCIPEAIHVLKRE